MNKKTPLIIEDYILQYPQTLQIIMQQLRVAIKEASPQATEKMSWGMPTFYLFGNLVHFAMNRHHIGFYPGESGVAHFQDRLTSYKTSKGAIQFPLDQPIPFDLIQDIVRYRTSENEKWQQEKIQAKQKTTAKKTSL